MEMMLLSEKLTATKAVDWGLVTRVAADDQLDATVGAVATELATGAPFAIGQIRKMAWAALQSSLDDALDLEATTQRRAVSTSDFREGVQAFIEKRPADRKSTRSELQSLMRISYAVFCLKKKKQQLQQKHTQ